MANESGAVILRDRHVDWNKVLTAEEQAEFIAIADELLVNIPYCPWKPNAGPQSAYLLDFGRESLYGGAAGGGKSIALMMAASQFLHVPGYSALLLRKTYADLERPGALMDIADQWWKGRPGVWFDRNNHRYTFATPDGGRSQIMFGGLDNETDRFKYQGGAFHFVGYDELTQFKERDYRYLFSRMRRVREGALSRIPIRMRCTTNPGGVGHEWVYKRFIAKWEAWKKGNAGRPPRNFWPALLADNPKLDQEDYIRSMDELDPVTRAQLLRGDWNIRPDGRMFKRRWFKLITRDQLPRNCTWVRYWDMATTEEMKASGELPDPDFTAGALVGRSPDGRYFIVDMKHWRYEPADNDLLVGATAILDTPRVHHWMEQEPAGAGKTAIHHFRTQVFDGTGVTFHPDKATGSKIVRAGPVASHADAGNVYIVVDGSWDHEDFLDEIEIFPDGNHDDMVDAISGAFSVLGKMHRGDLDFGRVNEEFEASNAWIPEAQKQFTLQDVRSGLVSRLVDDSQTEHWSPDLVRSEMASRYAV